jgi:hypothetical protein
VWGGGVERSVESETIPNEVDRLAGGGGGGGLRQSIVGASESEQNGEGAGPGECDSTIYQA